MKSKQPKDPIKKLVKTKGSNVKKISSPTTQTTTSIHEFLPQKVKIQIQQALLSWYRNGHRDLPWRKTQDPYKIWVSEIMLQQTRVETVKDYYKRFIEKFPTPQILAQAPLEEVLALWSGLGYYARARNLHKAAKEVTEIYGGTFPKEPDQVYQLAGIGPYTGGAILSIAFGQQAALVDGNVIRVFSRIFAIDDPLEESATKKKYWEIANALVPAPFHLQNHPQNHPGDFNQALMELGATVCLPQNPTCLLCPLQTICQAKQNANPHLYPPKKQQKEIPHQQLLTLILEHQGEVLITRRPPIGLWGGLYEFPTLEQTHEQDPSNPFESLIQLAHERLGISLKKQIAQVKKLPPFERLLTHRHFHFTPYFLSLQGKRPTITLNHSYDQIRWIHPHEPQALGFSVWMSKLINDLQKILTLDSTKL